MATNPALSHSQTDSKVWGRQGARKTLSFANPRYGAYQLDATALVEVWGVVFGGVNPRRRAVRG